MDVGQRDEDEAKGDMIGIFRWGYGGGFESVAFWGWVEEGLERSRFANSIVAGRSACLAAQDTEMRREVVRNGVMKRVCAPVARSTASPDNVRASIIHKQRKAVLCQAGNVFKAESHQPVQKNIAQSSRRSEVADIKTAQGVAESGTKTKTVKG